MERDREREETQAIDKCIERENVLVAARRVVVVVVVVSNGLVEWLS